MKDLIKRMGIYAIVAIVLYLLQAYIEGSFDIMTFSKVGKIGAAVLLMFTVFVIEITTAIWKAK